MIMNPMSVVVSKVEHLSSHDLEIVLVKAETPGKFLLFTLGRSVMLDSSTVHF